MTRKHLHILTLLVPALLLAGCKGDQWDDCITSAGPDRTEKRMLGHFNTIEVGDYTDLYLTQNLGEPEYAEVTAGSNLLGQIETTTSNGVLYIRNTNTCNWVRSFKLRTKVRVNLHTLAQLRTTEDAAVVGSDHLQLDDVTFINEGSNDIYIDADAGYLILQQKLQGDIRADGTAVVQLIYVEGVGLVNTEGCRAAYTYIKHYGKNNVTVNSWKGLEAYIYSSGNIFYVLQEPAEFKRVAIFGTGFMVLK